LALDMLYILRTPWWQRANPDGYTLSSLCELRPFLMRLGDQISSKVGWSGHAKEFHFGCHSNLSGRKLVWDIQNLERVQFEVWASMWNRLHAAPLGVRAPCMAAFPALLGAPGLPPLPQEIAEHILKFVIVCEFQDYCSGPVGFRAEWIFTSSTGEPNGAPCGDPKQLFDNLRLEVALGPCMWCAANIPEAQVMHVVGLRA
jgi:hypothetical protein